MNCLKLILNYLKKFLNKNHALIIEINKKWRSTMENNHRIAIKISKDQNYGISL